MSLTPEQSQLLSQMHADNQSSGFPFTATDHWLQANDNFSNYFESYGIGDVERQIYNSNFSTWCEANHPAYIGYAYHLLCSSVRSRNDWILDKAPPTNSANLYPTRGGPVSWDQLMSAHALVEIDRHVPILTEPLTLLDLGAGWGRIGHTLCQANPSARYIACDLPESLLVAKTYLSRLLPSQCHDYDTLSNEPGIYFLGSQGILRFEDNAIDVVVNIASFQEMTAEQVQAYLAIIAKKARWFYTFQDRERMPNVSRQTWALIFHKDAIWYDQYQEALYRMSNG